MSACMLAGQFFQNTNWFMTGMVLAWLAVTVGYVVVRSSQSIKPLEIGVKIYGIWVLVIEVSSPNTDFAGFFHVPL